LGTVFFHIQNEQTGTGDLQKLRLRKCPRTIYPVAIFQKASESDKCDSKVCLESVMTSHNKTSTMLCDEKSSFLRQFLELKRRL
jgi:hypothetical protein